MKKLVLILIVLLVLPVPVFAESGQEGPESISAASAILIEPWSGRVLFAKDPHQRRPMASTTKIMTALVAVELCEPDDVLKVQADCVKIEGCSLYLEENEQLTMLDLLYGLLLRSGNDAAAAIGKYVAGDIGHFVSLMNRKAWDLGMENTNYANPHGLDQEDHYSSAYDMAILGTAFMREPVLSNICMTDEYISRELTTGKIRLFINNNKLLVRDPRAIGIKIGWTDNAGRCLVAAARVGELELIAVVLDAPDLYTDVSKLFDYGFSNLTMQEFIPQGRVMAVLPVAHGDTRRVAVTAAQSVRFPVFAGETVSVTVKNLLPQQIEAPVQAGEVLGTALIDVDGQWTAEIELVATSAICVKAGPIRRLFGWLGRLGHD